MKIPRPKPRSRRLPNTHLKRILAVLLVALQRSRNRSAFYLAFLKRLLDRVLACLLRHRIAATLAAASVTTSLPPPLFAQPASFGPQQVITQAADRAASVFATDVDGDGDTDALSASATDDTVAWYENTNGDGSSWTVRTITTVADGAFSVFASDLDGDGDIDALSASTVDDTIAWYENSSADGDGTSWTTRTITTAADGAFTVFAADVDGDGDVDALSASFFDNTIAWYENTNQNGDGTSWTTRTITTSADGALSVFAADVDGDGDVDALSASDLDDTIAWYENADGNGTSWIAHSITTEADRARSVFASDVDGDGDIDVLSAHGILILGA